uniref:TAFII55 protein conserved region domain-containing protein n=1 Tax=Pseudo-nitzschia delicatissima TaxID=44447 RepID=A0A7S0TBH4_9STRA|mmetsp:Transcript_2363/g.5651  ORF Transcript_2363/g.5651 Transcript_2363/m.5651 type:complete len:361 (+) Transcript_2363:96-1178(+)|eukprot:CAMPEP_0116084264 /NCGR_PEP_ID=MMETSP0327-20121206/3711_1 /TAXON_ID=44447 /ORGANISM="Pseudo-nitzschia delicatissima, Strain B596" /LENGTH=360 /DNA_ID=CAMNT_0003575201 /DNA_START=59 /DNA_END=1141 /DNA_ORIENTATION=+
MADSHLKIRDRALILRVLVPGLETRLRDKMKEAEEAEDVNIDNPRDKANNATKAETLLDLEGVACVPTQDSSTLWNFHCDGATYPARLVNLPCPVEVHKTHDHAMYYKSCDIAQMLIVYEDSMALDEADAHPKTEGYPSYYHSGITPSMKNVVQKRYSFREHQPGTKYPRNEVSDVERELHELMCKISKESGKVRKPKIPSLATAQHQNKVLQEVEEVVVDYEPWMDAFGAEEKGITFDATDQIASMHPEIWLPAEKIEEIKRAEREKEEEEEKKRQKEKEKKQKKKQKKEKKAAAAAAKAAANPPKAKGIASKKNEEPIDEITAVAQLAMQAGDMFGDDDLDLGFDFEDMGGADDLDLF